MISVSYLYEQPNVSSGQANGLVAPFGTYNPPTKKEEQLLAQAQNMSNKDHKEQLMFMRKIGALV